MHSFPLVQSVFCYASPPIGNDLLAGPKSWHRVFNNRGQVLASNLTGYAQFLERLIPC